MGTRSSLCFAGFDNSADEWTVRRVTHERNVWFRVCVNGKARVDNLDTPHDAYIILRAAGVRGANDLRLAMSR